MYRYVFLTLIFCIVISLVPSGLVLAGYLNNTWFEQKLKAERDNYFIKTGKNPGEKATPEQSDNETPAFRIRPPEDIIKSIITTTDSIDVENARVRRQYEIPGLRVEKYYFMPIEDYVTDKFNKKTDTLWKAEVKKRMKDWAKREDSGGVTDLDFVIPVGQRFESLMGGKTNIKIDGSQRIEFSGKSEFNEGVIETATTKNSTFPSLTMKQEPKFSIRGNIGDRISVDIKQDSQAGPFSNLAENISLKYQGEDRDIIKYIEAGNTSLNLKGATFAEYSGSHRGLFGIRSESQLGPIELTAIASQEKSESNTKSFKGAAEEATKQIKDYEYKSNTYFFLDHVYRENFAVARDSFDRISYDPADSLAVFEVYINDNNDANDTAEGTLAYPGIAWPMELYNRNLDNENAAVEGFFHRLDPSKYYVNRELGFIQFDSRIPDEYTIGVYIVTQGDIARGIPAQQFGSLDYDSSKPGSKNIFKLIKRKGQRPTDENTWDLEWKNVYDLGQRNIDMDGLEIKIFLQATDGVSRDKQSGTPYIQILGLDKVDELGNPDPDNKVDFNRGFVDRFRGELIFPLLRPFDPDKPPEGVNVELAEKVPEIYDVYNRREKEEVTKYYIEIKTANRQSTIRLPAGFGGILENSEQVLLDGRKLTKGADYRINYLTGEVTMLNEDALSPNAKLDINYQEQNAFQQMQKTLFGLRSEYNLFSDSRFGAVFLFNNESTREKRVRLGNEPSRTTLFDADADINFQPHFLTTAVDMLPGVIANAPSKIRFQAEYAKSLPNMNTHGEVYIDDFEGSQNTPLSIRRTSWTMASKPDESTLRGMKLKKRGRLQWYNPWDRINSEDIWPNKETTAGENTVHVMNLAYGKAEGVADDESFAGVMNSFWGSGIDLSRARFIEIWARGEKGELKIDIGSISEDFYNKTNPDSLDGDGVLNTEDKPIPGLGMGDGILVKEEDTGLDGLFDKQEPGYSQENSDPNGDNWRYNSDSKNDYSRINATEGNAQDSDQAGIPDTEDINHNSILDTRNTYYEYSISFEDRFDPYLIEDSVPEGNPGGWRLFRIPLWNNLKAIEDGTAEKPDSTLVEFARLWITGTDSTVIQIASMEIVESNWVELGIFDSGDKEVAEKLDEILRISTKNTHENLDYNPPPGVKGELDRDTKIRRKEQSIVIELENLGAGHSGFIYRNFEKMDFTDYTLLKMNVHGPDDFPVSGSGESKYELIARFGGDKNNYYEYRTPIYRGWAEDSIVDIDLAECTELKLLSEYGTDQAAVVNEIIESLTQELADSLAVSMGDSLAHVVADSLVGAMADSLADAVADSLAGSLTKIVGNKTYTINGNPSLNNVKIISFGIKNNQSAGDITTEIWLDELRLDNLRDMGGTAYRADINADLSGFMQITGKVVEKSSDFHGMNTKKGLGKDDTKWDTSVKLNIDRFTPKRWGLSLPVSASISEGEALPRLKSNSDIILPENQKKDFRTYTKDKKARISYKKRHDPTKRGIKGIVTQWAFEKVTADLDWGENFSLSPVQGENKSDNKQLKVTYDVNPKARSFVLLGWMPAFPTDLGGKISNAEFNYTPSVLNYNYTFNERNIYTTDIDGIVETPKKTRTSNEKLNFTYDPFKSIKYTYARTKTRDAYLKQEVNYLEENKITITGPELLNITNKYNYDIKYDEDNNPKSNQSAQLGFRTIKFNKSFSATADFAFNKFLEEKLSGKPKPPKTMQPKDSNRPTWSSLFGLNKKEDTADDSDDNQAEEESLKETESDNVEERQENDKNESGDVEQRDTSSDKQPEKEEKIVQEKKGDSFRTKAVMAISKSLSPISFEYKEGEQLNYSGIPDRPDFMTRIGQGTINPPDTSSVVSSRNTSANTKSYSARTRINLPFDIGVRTTAKFDESGKITSSVSERSESFTFPDITLNWNKLEEKMKFLKRYFSNMNLNSNFLISKGKNYQNDSTKPKTDRTEIKYSPLISISTKVMKKLDASFSFNNSNQVNKDLSGDITSLSLVDTKSTLTKIRYQLNSSEGLPLFKSLKLKSDINLTLEYSTNASTTEREVGEEKGALIKDDSSRSVSFNASYNFSQKFRGGAKMRISSKEDITKKVHKIREISIWCEISFN